MNKLDFIKYLSVNIISKSGNVDKAKASWKLHSSACLFTFLVCCFYLSVKLSTFLITYVDTIRLRDIHRATHPSCFLFDATQFT